MISALLEIIRKCEVHTPLMLETKIGDDPFRSSHPEVFYQKGVLRNFRKFTGKHWCQNLFFHKVVGHFIKKEILAQLFSCEFCEISKNNFFHRTPLVAASIPCPKFQSMMTQNKQTLINTLYF